MVAKTPSCHEQASTRTAPAGSPIIAFVGAPNGGKSTLFNQLTGSGRAMGNWPGTSVEIGRGTWGLPAVTCHDAACEDAAREVDAIDFPGAYSLDPLSPDEALTRTLLLEVPAEERPDLVVVVADATSLARSLYLAAQIREQPYRVVVAVTMNDVAGRRGLAVDAAELSAHLGCPVVLLDPRHRSGTVDLARTVAATLADPVPPARPGFAASAAPAPAAPAAPAVSDMSACCCEPGAAECHCHHDAGSSSIAPAGAPVPQNPVPPTRTQDRPGAAEPGDAEFAAADNRFAWIDAAVTAAVTSEGDPPRSASEKADRVLLHPVAGPFVFLAVMWCVFELTTTVAAPFQDFFDQLFSGPVSDGATWLLTALHLDHPLVLGLVVDGLIGGVGTVLTFVPLMAIMFLLLALLEDSGYMARAAVVADRLMRTIGLPGKAFLPVIVGFGCNVPAISATRVLGDAKHRLLTSLLIPFTSCSARLTVYVMLAQVFFPGHAGTVVFAMYLVSIGLVVGTGFLLKHTLWRAVGDEPLLMDLPTYQRPTARLIGQITWMRLRGFLATAGGIIVVVVTVVWLLQAIPAHGGYAIGSVPPSQSLYAAVAGFIAPIFGPAGFGEWRAVGALITGFLAKEAVISSWAQTYSVPDVTDATPAAQGHSALAAQLGDTFAASSGGHAALAAVAFMLFLLAYTPCVATLAAQKREIGTTWTVIGVGLQLAVAYLLAVVVFQVGVLFL